ncbi:hypothetical protein LX32DRAFT_457754 [Colletotrichum zoysiae]|uniref:Uncharacterized protein n=1 Tax=Colletotrichum zoysiae TaxID=1216348 RepID=A0AAD9LZT3_9PEZI|nr:hypothetical protein LX32DRAFT_457754 [Colletotrichum zoysiae]
MPKERQGQGARRGGKTESGLDSVLLFIHLGRKHHQLSGYQREPVGEGLIEGRGHTTQSTWSEAISHQEMAHVVLIWTLRCHQLQKKPSQRIATPRHGRSKHHIAAAGLPTSHVCISLLQIPCWLLASNAMCPSSSPSFCPGLSPWVWVCMGLCVCVCMSAAYLNGC